MEIGSRRRLDPGSSLAERFVDLTRRAAARRLPRLCVLVPDAIGVTMIEIFRDEAPWYGRHSIGSLVNWRLPVGRAPVACVATALA